MGGPVDGGGRRCALREDDGKGERGAGGIVTEGDERSK